MADQETAVEAMALIIAEAIARQGLETDNLGDGESVLVFPASESVCLNLAEIAERLRKEGPVAELVKALEPLSKLRQLPSADAWGWIEHDLAHLRVALAPFLKEKETTDG